MMWGGEDDYDFIPETSGWWAFIPATMIIGGIIWAMYHG
jgi:hypothetical protein